MDVVILAQGGFLDFISRNWALVSIISTIFIIVMIIAFVLGRYIKIMLNIMRDTPPPFSMGPLDFERIEGQIVRFRAFDGVSLRGMFLFSTHTNGYKGTIIFCHEYASDMYSCARYCKPLLEAGFDIFSFDYRGHGESSCDEHYQPRQWVSDREISDTLGALAFVEDYLESQGLPVEVGIFGISRGAGAAVISSSRNPTVKAIVTDGLFSTDITLEGLMKKWAYIFAKVRFVYENHPPAFWKFLRWLMLIFAHRKFHCIYPSVKKAIERMIPRPFLMIHGERDNYIPMEQAKILYKLIPGNEKDLWIVPGAKHNQGVTTAPTEYAHRTVEFFEKHLTRETKPSKKEEVGV